LGLSDYESPRDLDVSPAPVIRQEEAVAAATPMETAGAEVPMALAEDLKRLHISTPTPKPAPKKSFSMADDGIKFTGLTPDAVKVWLHFFGDRALTASPSHRLIAWQLQVWQLQAWQLQALQVEVWQHQHLWQHQHQQPR